MKTILTLPDPILKNTCTPVDKDDDTVHDLIKEMTQIVLENGLAGLASCQVGDTRRVFVVDLNTNVYGDKTVKNVVSFINPKIKVLRDKGQSFDWECCASIPRMAYLVSRYNAIQVDVDGEVKTYRNYIARVIQHENDHLNGTLINSKARQVRVL